MHDSMNNTEGGGTLKQKKYDHSDSSKYGGAESDYDKIRSNNTLKQSQLYEYESDYGNSQRKTFNDYDY